MDDEEKNKIFDEMEDLVEDDIARKGYTDRKCPFCGTNLKMEGTTVSHSIFCEKDGCFKYTVRGL